MSVRAWFRSLRPEVEMPPNSSEGMSTPAASVPGTVYPHLSDAEIEGRLAAATRRLRELGEVFDTTDLPMSSASDAELDVRIRHAEQLLAAGGTDDVALLDELRVLDYLIANPSATVPPLWSLKSQDPSVWSDEECRNALFAGAWDVVADDPGGIPSSREPRSD